MKKVTKRRHDLLLTFLVLGLLLIYLLSDQIASFVWQKFRNAPVALSLNKGDANLAFEIGNYYFNGGAYDIEKARKAFKEAKLINPKLPLVSYQLGRIDFVDGKFELALKEINEEIALNPNFGRAYYMLGLINGFSKKLDNAEADFKKVMELDGKDKVSWAVYNDLSWIQFQKGDYKSVELTAREGLTYHPDNPWLLNSLGLALHNLKRDKEAKKVLGQALNLANALSVEDVRKAYPGNDASQTVTKRDTIIKSIQFNLNLTK